MKVLHLSGANIDSGAGRGALWLHEALLENGIDSKILTNSENIIDINNIIYTNDSLDKNREYEKLILKDYPNKRDQIFSSGLFGIKLSNYKDVFEADLIHLHWINDCLIDIRDLLKINKPIIWTLRDMWPFTGGCHQNFACDKFKSNCYSCPALDSDKNKDLSSLIQKTKQFYYPEDISYVAISHWIANRAKESSILKNCNIRTIHNNIKVTEFENYDKFYAKKELGISTDKKIILIGARDIFEPSKGINKFIEACKIIDYNKYALCVFGNNGNELNSIIGFTDFYNFGYLEINKLNLLYSAADLFVAPSIVEPFGKTVAEAMLCSTPAVAFDETGIADIIDHKKNGYLASDFCSNELAIGIEWLLNNNNYTDISNEARIKILNNFDSKIIAEKHIALYHELLGTKVNDEKNEIDLKIAKVINSNGSTTMLSILTDIRKLISKLNTIIEKDKTYILYGYGSFGKFINSLYNQNIIAIVDNSLENVSNDTHPISYIKECINYDGIIISSIGYEKEIIKKLTAIGVDESKLISLSLE